MIEQKLMEDRLRDSVSWLLEGEQVAVFGDHEKLNLLLRAIEDAGIAKDRIDLDEEQCEPFGAVYYVCLKDHASLKAKAAQNLLTSPAPFHPRPGEIGYKE